MIPLFALVVVLAMPQTAAAQPGRPAIAKIQVKAAAKQCGTSVRFVDMPSGLRPLVAAQFAYNLNPSATKMQRDCFYELIPTTRVGFISELPPPAKKK